MSSSTSSRRVLNDQNINPNLIKAEYAVRGEIANRAEQYRKTLSALQSGPPQTGATELPFSNVISANIGNPQQLDQKPITFFRQVLSILEYPALLQTEEIFPEDVKTRARILLKEVGSVGAYSQSQGAFGVRKSVAGFIESWCPSVSPRKSLLCLKVPRTF
jgi:alanine transaminase